MTSPSTNPNPPDSSASLTRLRRTTQVIVVSSVMFTFISYWKTAAVVLCDLASTAYYIGGIVEQSIGPAAPWFILAVMVFSYAVRSVYIESCTLFVRGGVYRVVREALGKFMAKIAVSALMFDYILTGPISGVSAGQYTLGLLRDLYFYLVFGPETDGNRETLLAAQLFFKPWLAWGSVVIACSITLYFFRQNIRGIHESSDKAMKIMVVTTIMAAILVGWCGVTLAINNGPTHYKDEANHERVNSVPLEPRIEDRPNPDTKEMESPLGFLRYTPLAEQLKTIHGGEWLSLVGLAGIFIAFGHSILAMSGEETLAQVYREVESPKLRNFKKAAFIVFVYSIVLTAGISFLAVLIIPDNVRMAKYSDNLLGGLAMNVIGPTWARLALNAVVVAVGGLILAGAVNTAIIGSNGVLNRVAEDGVMPEWFLKPHARFGTTYRILYLIVGLQLFTIIVSGGNVLLLGEAYAFGVVWSFVFQALAMVVLRFKDPRPREAKAPLNVRMGIYEIPIGLILILLVLVLSAFANLLTKETATVGGLGFTAVFFGIFWVSERLYERRRHGAMHTHIEQFNRTTADGVTPAGLGLNKPYRKLVSIRSVHNLFMLERALGETDPATTSMVVMTAKVVAPGDDQPEGAADLDKYDQQLMTAVVDRAEKAGKQVKPLIVPTNNALHAVLKTAMDLKAQELILGASNKYTVDEQMEHIAFYWISLHAGQPEPLTVRILSRERDMYLDLAGGSRIPKISERQARSVAELRAAGVGVDRVLLLYDGSAAHSDLFLAVLTMLDPQVRLGLLPIPAARMEVVNADGVQREEEKARQLGRPISIVRETDVNGAAVVERVRADNYDLIILPVPGEETSGTAIRALDDLTLYILLHAPCHVFLAAAAGIPQEVVDSTPSVT
jgi:amino acid transporter